MTIHYRNPAYLGGPERGETACGRTPPVGAAVASWEYVDCPDCLAQRPGLPLKEKVEDMEVRVTKCERNAADLQARLAKLETRADKAACSNIMHGGAGVAFGGVSVFSPNVGLLEEAEKLRRENIQAENELARVSDERDRAMESARKNLNALTTASQERDRARDALGEINREYTAKCGALSNAWVERSEALEQVEKLEKLLSDTKNTLIGARRESTQRLDHITRLRASCDDAYADLITERAAVSDRDKMIEYARALLERLLSYGGFTENYPDATDRARQVLKSFQEIGK